MIEESGMKTPRVLPCSNFKSVRRLNLRVPKMISSLATIQGIRKKMKSNNNNLKANTLSFSTTSLILPCLFCALFIEI